jgi:hypothetical protein
LPSFWRIIVVDKLDDFEINLFQGPIVQFNTFTTILFHRPAAIELLSKILELTMRSRWHIPENLRETGDCSMYGSRGAAANFWL